MTGTGTWRDGLRTARATRITRVDWFSFAVYPLSGGFRPWSLIGDKLAARLLRIERAIEHIGWPAAFRMMLVIEKCASEVSRIWLTMMVVASC